MKPKKPTMKQVATELVRLDLVTKLLLKHVEELEKNSHPPKDFVKCEDCKCNIKPDE